jgi:hypothetical protein
MAMLPSLHAIEFFIAEIRLNCRQNALEAPAALLHRIIVMPPGDRLEIDKPLVPAGDNIDAPTKKARKLPPSHPPLLGRFSRNAISVFETLG